MELYVNYFMLRDKALRFPSLHRKDSSFFKLLTYIQAM
jgi:hypothetical protein